MNKKLLIASLVCLFATYAQPVLAAKVGDPCTPKGGGAGHWVKPFGAVTIKCQADAATIIDSPRPEANAPRDGAVAAPHKQPPKMTGTPARARPAVSVPSSVSKSTTVSTTSVLNINTMTKPELTAVPGLSSDAMWTMMNFRTPFGYDDGDAFATRVCSRTSVNFGSTDIQIGNQTLSGFQCAKAALTYQANGNTHSYALPIELTGSSTVPVAPTP